MKPIVSIPCRAFGGSDPHLARLREGQHTGFNTLSGIRGFGPNPAEAMKRLGLAFPYPVGHSGVRTELERQYNEQKLLAFQYPVGHSGVRTIRFHH